MNPRSFAIVRELFWCKCLQVCGLSARCLYSEANGDFSKRTYATGCTSQTAADRAPVPMTDHLCLCRRHSSTDLVQSLGWEGFSSAFPFISSNHLLWVWDLILDMIVLLLPSCWGFSFAIGCNISFINLFIFLLGFNILLSVNGCSAASCNFAVLTGKDEHTSFYSVILAVVAHQTFLSMKFSR